MNTTQLTPEQIAGLIEVTKNLQRQLASTNVRGKTRKPYFTEKYGAWAKGVVDDIFRSGDVLAGAKSLGLHNPDIAPETIRTQWYQGSEYLVKVLDPSYEEKVKQISATPDKRRGLILSIKPASTFAALIPIENWRADIEDFIDNSTQGDLLRKAGLPLREEDIIWLDELLTPLKTSLGEPFFAWERPNIKTGTIEIVRIR